MKHPSCLLYRLYLEYLALAMLCAACWGLPGCTHSPDDNAAPTVSAIKHLVVIIQENHTFDNYFGRYCTAPPSSQPACDTGPACCEAAPSRDPGTASPATALTDAENQAYSPVHFQDCELAAMDGGKMDGFVSNKLCGNPRAFAIAPPEVVGPYWSLAKSGALADHYFQPVAGASSSNDMYLARARFVFQDDQVGPDSVGTRCGFTQNLHEYTEPTIGDLLAQYNVSWAFYAGGYQAMLDASRDNRCPAAPSDCPFGVSLYPCVYDPSDNPFQYYSALRDNPAYMRDLQALDQDLQDGTLPAVSFVKAIGYKSEHPGAYANLHDGIQWVTGLVDQLQRSQYGEDTLILLVYDEGGGYFDHIAPPAVSPVDGQPYGTRVPFLALGPFARQNHIAHTTLEHSSIVKFIEWNWLSGHTGQLGNRDAAVNNLGALLDPARTAVAVPES